MQHCCMFIMYKSFIIVLWRPFARRATRLPDYRDPISGFLSLADCTKLAYTRVGLFNLLINCISKIMLTFVIVRNECIPNCRCWTKVHIRMFLHNHGRGYVRQC